MKLLQRNTVERDLIEVGDIRLVRIKNYNSHRGETTIIWKFQEDMKEVKESFSKRLEKKFLKSQRRRATIIKQ